MKAVTNFMSNGFCVATPEKRNFASLLTRIAAPHGSSFFFSEYDLRNSFEWQSDFGQDFVGR